MRTVGRGTWIKLNADGVLIGCLGIMSVFDFVHPDKSDYADSLGHVPQTYYLWTAMKVLGGVVMLIGFAAPSNKKVGIELAGRYLLVQALFIELWRAFQLFGADDIHTFQVLFVLIIVTGLFGMRASALLSKRGVSVVIGGPKRDKQ